MLTKITFVTYFSRQDNQESPKSSKIILPKSAFVPVGNSSVQLTSSSTLNPSVIGITQETVASSVAKPGGTNVQVSGGRTSPVIVVAPSKLQPFGTQIIMLASPNSAAASGTSAEKPGTVSTVSEVENNHTGSNTTTKSTANTEVHNTNIDSCSVGNTISLPETSTCSPEGEALLDKLDMMETDGDADKKAKDKSTQEDVVDLHELTAYLTSAQDESVLVTSTTSDTAQPSESAVTVSSSQETTAATTVVTSVDSINSVTRSLGFNPISPADQNNCGSNNEGGTSEVQNDDIGQIPEDDKLAHTTQNTLKSSSRPSSVEGLYSSVSLHIGNRSRPNSRGAAPSPGLKQSGGFVHLGEHTRDSPNIFVSIQSTMPPTGKYCIIHENLTIDCGELYNYWIIE